MSLTLEQVITAARDRHPAFHRTRVPNAVLARFLSDFQNEVIGKGAERDKQFLQQKAAVVLSTGGTTAPGEVGAGVGDGLPGSVDPATGFFSAIEETAGSLIEPLLTPAEGATVAVADHPVTSATATSLTCTAVARTLNQDAGKLLVIVSGTGKDQRREVQSNNTATTWVISNGSDGRQWDTIPDSTSIFQVIDPAYTSSLGLGVATDLPNISQRTGYLVKLSAAGLPYIDWTAPLIADVADGLAMPNAIAIVGGTVRYSDEDEEPLNFVSQGRRYCPPAWPAVYTVGPNLFFCGRVADWEDAASLELDYVPIAPAFTALTDYFLLPDAARPLLVAQAAAFMAGRVADEVGLDPTRLELAAADALQHFLMTIRLTRRARRVVIREG